MRQLRAVAVRPASRAAAERRPQERRLPLPRVRARLAREREDPRRAAAHTGERPAAGREKARRPARNPDREARRQAGPRAAGGEETRAAACAREQRSARIHAIEKARGQEIVTVTIFNW